ncbi:MAG: phosphotransferase, partial [Planctomycetota bacterium]
MAPTDDPEAPPVCPPTPFGATLEPVLRDHCAGRLSPINWFRTAWQRGGALTGYATFADDTGDPHPVVVKLPVPPRERRWLLTLQTDTEADRVVPRLFAHGESLGAYDFAWVVMQRLPHGPLGPAWAGREFDLVVAAAGRFYRQTAGVPLDPHAGPRQRDWQDILDRGRKHVQDRGTNDPQRWKAALKRAAKKLDAWTGPWLARPAGDWCHGDFHLGNAMSHWPADHDHPDDAAGVLIDLAEVRVGHWVEDAVYLEHLFWSRPHRLAGRKLVSMIARQRKAHG